MLNVITNKAMDGYDFTVPYDHVAYVQHWLDTADEIKSDMEREGLTETVRHIDDIIKDQQRFMHL